MVSDHARWDLVQAVEKHLAELESDMETLKNRPNVYVFVSDIIFLFQVHCLALLALSILQQSSRVSGIRYQPVLLGVF